MYASLVQKFAELYSRLFNFKIGDVSYEPATPFLSGKAQHVRFRANEYVWTGITWKYVRTTARTVEEWQQAYGGEELAEEANSYLAS